VPSPSVRRAIDQRFLSYIKEIVMPNLIGKTTDPGIAGVLGESSTFNGVLGVTTADGHAGVAGVSDTGVSNGVYGRSKQANGVIGFSSATGHSGVTGVNDDGTGAGVYGRSSAGAGVRGESKRLNGVLGVTSADGHAGVAGANDKGNGNGVYGRSAKSDGVIGITTGNGKAGVAGVCDSGNGNGVYGRSKTQHGVLGITSSASRPGVLGQNDGTGPGVEGHSKNEAGVRGVSTHGTGVVGIGGTFAAEFVGHVRVQGNIGISGDVILSGADYAEALSTKDLAIEAGCVVAIGADGGIHLCDRDYDSSVAGIVSGAGGVKPAIVLDRHEGSADVALIGKVWCRADADVAPIRPGDLLTTSSTTGHCRRVTEPERAFGAIIGKALTPLPSGKGLVRVLVSPR
jgi:hypothetical protein